MFSCADTEFTTKGKTVLCDGWKELERRYWATLKGKPNAEGDEENELILDVPTFAEGQSFDSPAARVTAHDTQPPKPHTEASLLSAMERAGSADTDPDAERRGLGTPATRAAVIEKLVKSGFVQRKGKQLIPTKNGNHLVCVLPDTLTSPQLTAEWENALTQIAKGAADPEDFMRGIKEMARELVKAYPFLSENQKDLFKEEQTVIGKCPRCGGNVCEGRKSYYCEKKDCAFVMWQRTYAASIGKGYPFRKIPVLTLRAEWGFCLYPHRLSPVGAVPWEVSQTLCNDERRRKPCRTSRKQS